ncbi:MAG TPA: ROK family transcriptional regulator [Roseiflexaceae bacterium]|nr:ROK family transcriptional regulator [Roseiflexaceae bacterium]
MHNLLKKATRQHTKDHNSRLVLQTIYDGGQMSRADLARLTHLTRTTVSEVVSELIEQGLVEEVGHGPSSIGRTPTLLSVADDSRHVIAVNITNTELQGAIVTLRGVIRHRAQLPLLGQDGNAVLVQLFSFIDGLVKATTQPLLGIGISTPGLIDTTSGIVRRAVNFGWQDLLLRNIVQSHYNVPIYVANDSHMIALAEYMFGQNQSSANLVVIKVGQGIGAGIILNGQLFSGDDFGAGEIGHVVVVEDGPLCKCGNYGCLESVASIPWIVRRAQEIAEVVTTSPLSEYAAEGRAIDLDAVVQAFAAGDPAVRRLIEEVGRHLGIAVANLVGILNVRRVVITGRVAPFGQVLGDAIRQELGRRVLPALAEATEIDVLAPGPDTVLLGTSALLLTNELGLTRLIRREAQAEEIAA